ncbi:flavin monoamine oxidase family protein [Streptomyces sp. NPDC001339]|uniref:flavin monoamine oxidase family protein n=1 Tax=Streptomyces sp. NPDC001339 TaxID=3364563 RepID=UPI0036A93205
MARTPAMHLLKSMAAEHKAARRMRIPADELRGLRADAAAGSGSSRRELLKRAAATGIATAGLGLAGTPAYATGRPAPTRRPDSTARIAVIGAGIAGLVAALTLKDAGVDCTVYEANPDRVGGRMYSQTAHWANGQTSEIGGELIDTSHTRMRRLVRRFGLNLEDREQAAPSGAREVLWFNGTYYPRTQADRDFQPVYRALRRDAEAAGVVTWEHTTEAGTALDNMTAREWIESRVPGGFASPLGQFLDVAYNTEYATDTTELSALALVQQLSEQDDPAHFDIFGASDEVFHIAGGNDRLPQAIAASLPSGTVKLGWSLQAVRANTDGTQTLTFTEGTTTRTVHADHTILAVPLGVLQRIDLTRAGFDARMTHLLRAARMGTCTKLNMQFTSRPWRGTGPWPGISAGDSFTGDDVQLTWETTRTHPGPSGILLQYGGGSLAENLAPATPFSTESDPYVRRLVQRTLKGIDAYYPGTQEAWNGRAQLSAWHRNPYSHGAYTYLPVGYIHRFNGYEATPQGNIRLAGEHCSIAHLGFMEGGAETGEAAAGELLKAL